MPLCSQLHFYLTDDVSLLYRLYLGSFDFIFDGLFAAAIDAAQARAVWSVHLHDLIRLYYRRHGKLCIFVSYSLTVVVMLLSVHSVNLIIQGGMVPVL